MVYNLQVRFFNEQNPHATSGLRGFLDYSKALAVLFRSVDMCPTFD